MIDIRNHFTIRLKINPLKLSKVRKGQVDEYYFRFEPSGGGV